MKSAEPRNLENMGWFVKKIDPWFNNDYEFVNYDMEEVEERYENVKNREGNFSRYLKDAMLHVASVSYDAVLDGDMDCGEFEQVLDSTREHVAQHYFGDGDMPDPEIPDLDRETRQFSKQGLSERQYAMDLLAESVENGDLESFYKNVTGKTPDRGIGISGGGIEPAIIASEGLGIKLDIVRCSSRKRNDTAAHDIHERDYSGENILILDDIVESGTAAKAIEEYAEENGAENVVFDAGIPEWEFGKGLF